jgi:hypothetical protein
MKRGRGNVNRKKQTNKQQQTTTKLNNTATFESNSLE